MENFPSILSDFATSPSPRQAVLAAIVHERRARHIEAEVPDGLAGPPDALPKYGVAQDDVHSTAAVNNWSWTMSAMQKPRGLPLPAISTL